MKPEVLVRVLVPKETLAILEQDFVLRYAPSASEFETAVQDHGEEARAVITNGSTGLSAAQIRAIPNLELIQTVGVGVELIDMGVAREKGIIVASSAGTNDFSVAEQGIALLLAVLRDVVDRHTAIHNGIWEDVRYPGPVIYGKRVGILGLGEVGMALAKRLVAFEAEVGYHNRKPRADVDFIYHRSLLDLARASDILMISCPGGEATQGIVNRKVIEALGPSGVLVNVGRGSVVMTDALLEALHNRSIAGAGLDVWEGEPDIPKALLSAPKLVLSPHIGGRSPESLEAARQRIVGNLKNHFAGAPVAYRVN